MNVFFTDCVDSFVVNYDLPKAIEVYIWRMRHTNKSDVDSERKVVSFYVSTTDRNLVPALVDYLQLVYYIFTNISPPPHIVYSYCPSY